MPVTTRSPAVWGGHTERRHRQRHFPRYQGRPQRRHDHRLRGRRLIVLTDANLAGFTFNLAGNTLTYTGGSLTLQGSFTGYQFAASAAAGGGVQLTLQASLPSTTSATTSTATGAATFCGAMTTAPSSTGWPMPTAASPQPCGCHLRSLPTDWQVVGTGDFNGDGRDDILWRNDNGTVTDWLGQANGSFVSNNAVATFALGTEWQVAGTGDFNGDGRDDILWRNDVGAMYRLARPGQRRLRRQSQRRLSAVRPTGRCRHRRLQRRRPRRHLVAQRGGALTDWLGQANGSFADNRQCSPTSCRPTGSVAATGDFNGDGRDDILWRNEDGAMRLARQPTAASPTTANAAYQLPTNWQIAGTGDFNGDGRDDIFWRNDVGAMSAMARQRRRQLRLQPQCRLPDADRAGTCSRKVR